MESKAIIKSIKEIYQQFHIPPWLALHMRRVAAVGEIICNHWQGQPLDKDDIVAVLLVHDLGNIAKMDFDTPDALQLMAGNTKGAVYWKATKEKMIRRYGSNDHEATLNMVQEIGVSGRLLFLLKNQKFLNNEFTMNSSDGELKICSYADQRIGPFGVLSLKERFKDFAQRYRHDKRYPPEAIQKIVACAFEIEKQILANMKLRAEEINDETIKQYVEQYG